ncbi:MAG: SAM-dependent methyltransferase, partial [Thermoplasmatota archaeon]
EALYGEGGYYTRAETKTGTDPATSDFATSPTLHPFFAHAVAKEAADAWRRAGSPLHWIVVEFGGGEGHLARDALAYLDDHETELASRVQWLHVETSPFHREKQQQAAAGDGRVAWVEEAPPSFDGFVVANEFLDALPFHWLERRKANWAGVRVRWDEGAGRFEETLGMPDPLALPAAPQGSFAEEQRVVAMADAKAWLEAMGPRLRRGAVLLVDYGDRGAKLWGRGSDGTVRGFRGHELVADVLAAPGEVDITASVDFDQTATWGAAAGLQESSFESQEAFLVRHGALEALNALPRDTEAEASAYLRLRQLVLPTGLGGAFRVQRLEKGLEPASESEG